MRDAERVILYVGKAKNLKKRLVTYFQGDVHPIGRTEMLVGRVATIELILTETEDEALILECTLIKKHKPRFNVMMKDDKAYPYLKIRMDIDFPRIEWTRRVHKDGARYFGPFPSAWSARLVMNLLNETFQLRDCADNTFRHRSRACILYQMKQCTGPCVGHITALGYRERLDQVVGVLEGRSETLIQDLQRGMEEAAEEENFETAAMYRDQITSLNIVTATQGVDQAGTFKSRDVVGLARHDSEAHGVILIVRNGRVLAVRHYHLQNTDPQLSDAEILSEFLSQYYAQSLEEEQKAEREGVLASDSRAQEVMLPESITGPVGGGNEIDWGPIERTCGLTFVVPDGDADRRLSSVAHINAKYAIEQAARRALGHGVQALEDVKEKLQLQKLPQRIECFDISNIQGEDAVASRVVFIDGAPDKNLYRRYKIRTVEGSNDFAMMKEVLGRRFMNDPDTPDLVVVDGGKGQLSQATAILEELGVQGVGVVGLAKARTESNFRATEVKSSMERIFIPGRKNPVNLLPHTSAYKLLTHVRDEAHRFAISYHRKIRDKRSIGSRES